uniref:mannose-1-phosphate guanylyltransferase n=1 Tax=candidate division WOR-3 bacterium TaxID=2052148 RepID=A0A7V3PUF5_UNCW3
MNNIYGVILCGGKGERFWPKSRQALPKQFVKLFENRSLLQATSARIGKLCPLKQQFFVAPERFAELLKKELRVKTNNLILEPKGKNTAPAIGLAAALLFIENPSAIMVVLPADHFIKPENEFLKAVRLAVKVARQGYLVTFGIVPSRPDTGYGYIETGEQLIIDNSLSAYKVKAFKEKPDRPMAEEYLKSGRFLWNSGMFVWRVDVILEAFARFMPDFHQRLMKLVHLKTKNERKTHIRRIYNQVESISIDYAIMEKAENVAVIRAGFDWDDVGSWLALERRLTVDEKGNAIRGLWFGIGTEKCIIYCDEGVIGTLGLKNLVIARSGDALLVAQKDALGDLKQLLALMQKDSQGCKYL